MALDDLAKVPVPSDLDESIEMLEDGSMEVDLDAGNLDEEVGLAAPIDFKEGHYENLVPLLDDEELYDIGTLVCNNVDNDEISREDWMKSIEMGLDLLGIKLEEKNEPFQGACSAQHPLMMESAVKFQSKATSELIPSKGPVHVKIIGESSVEREDQAVRVRNHMNWQITEQMSEYYTDTERMLLYVPLIGSGFKKTYYDSELERPVSEFVPADQFVVPNNASDLPRAPRYTHKLYMTKDQLNHNFASKFFHKPETLGEPSQPLLNEVQQKTAMIEGIEIDLGDEDKVYTLYEQHVNLHLPDFDDREGAEEFELTSPYIVTVDADSKAVLGIRRNWKEGDNQKRRRLMKFTHYGFVPGFGFYHYGFIQLLGNLQLSLTSSLRSLVDAGQFSNLQGGFKLKGTRIQGSNEPIAPGEFKEVEAAVQDINKAIMRLPFGEPSATLYQMLEFLDRKGQKFADSTEQVIADSTNYGPVGTTLALLDASTKFFSAVHKRLHNAQKHELRLIANINGETLKSDSLYNKSNPSRAVTRKDYNETIDVVPVSDPNISSNAHRIAKAQTILDIAMKTPQQHDMREVLKHVYTNMDYDNVEKILPEPAQAQEQDPLTDIQTAVAGKPIKAFPGQDHAAHIGVKQAFLSDPMSGGSQTMASVQQVLNANVQEHMLLQFQEQVQAAQQAGQPTGDPMGQSPSDPTTQGQGDMVQAANHIVQLNVQKLQQQMEQQQLADDKTDEAAMLMAEAEHMSAETEQRKELFEEQYKTAQLELDKEKLDLDKMREIGKMITVDAKIAGDIEKIVTTKSLDAMIEGLHNMGKTDKTTVVHKDPDQ